MPDLIIETATWENITVNWTNVPNVAYWPVNFTNLEENQKSFQDPKYTKQDW
jgi:hypothetical protein